MNVEIVNEVINNKEIINILQFLIFKFLILLLIII